MVIVKTPMLVPLLRFIEEGSDKLVALSLCIDKFIYTIFKERFDTDIYLNTSEKERVSCADDLKNNIVRYGQALAGRFLCSETGIAAATVPDKHPC